MQCHWLWVKHFYYQRKRWLSSFILRFIWWFLGILCVKLNISFFVFFFCFYLHSTQHAVICLRGDPPQSKKNSHKNDHFILSFVRNADVRNIKFRAENTKMPMKWKNVIAKNSILMFKWRFGHENRNGPLHLKRNTCVHSNHWFDELIIQNIFFMFRRPLLYIQIKYPSFRCYVQLRIFHVCLPASLMILKFIAPS